jgi:hypothetical protein
MAHTRNSQSRSPPPRSASPSIYSPGLAMTSRGTIDKASIDRWWKDGTFDQMMAQHTIARAAARQGRSRRAQPSLTFLAVAPFVGRQGHHSMKCYFSVTLPPLSTSICTCLPFFCAVPA